MTSENDIDIALLQQRVEELSSNYLTKKDFEIILLKIGEISSKVSSLEGDVKTFNEYVNKWKGASFLLFAVGAVASFALTWVWNIAQTLIGKH